jgi:hypothetical protein
LHVAAFDEFKRLALDEFDDAPPGSKTDFKQGSVHSYLAFPTVWQFKVTAYASFSTTQERTTRKRTDR